MGELTHDGTNMNMDTDNLLNQIENIEGDFDGMFYKS
jgi:hypothetical protein